MVRADTVILIFSHTPDVEATRKNFGLGARNSAAARALRAHAQRVAEASGLPVLTVGTDRQRGDTFGARLAHACGAAFARGYKGVIAIGSDCPALHAGLLRAAAGRLAGGRSVVGPATDGGVYLLGLRREDFDAAQFAALPWCTAALGAALAAALPANLTTLPSLTDVDDSADWRRALDAPAARSLRGLFGAVSAPFYFLPSPPSAPTGAISRRGPPSGTHLAFSR